MTSTSLAGAAPAPRPQWAIDAGVAAFAATTGALMVFGRARAGVFDAFAHVGRRVARDILLPHWGDVTVGLVIHLGETLILGAIAAALIGAGDVRARLRGAFIGVILWELAPLIAPFAAVRADVAADLPLVPRVGLALLLAGALAFGPRR